MTLDVTRLNRRVMHAKSAVGRGTRYVLGQGGFHPLDSLPTRSAACDCSGFAAWVLGISRWQADKGKPWSKHIPWIETSAIVADATGPQRLFKRITSPVPGCLVVYGDKKVLGVRRQGHVGIVAEVVNGRAVKVIHCSKGNDRTGDAIQITGPNVFENGRSIYCLLKEDWK